jgi:hypothetical protein
MLPIIGRRTVEDMSEYLTPTEVQELSGLTYPLTPERKENDPPDEGEPEVTTQEAAETGTDNQEVRP